MQFLADESCDFAIVRALRDGGYDVLAVADSTPGIDDDAVLELAVRGKRVLLTEDKDFGQWVYSHGRDTAGVILLRYPPAARMLMPPAAVGLVERLADQIQGCFVVMQPGRVRIGRPGEE